MKFIIIIFILVSINFINYEVSATGLGDLEEVYTLFMNIWTRIDEGIEEANTGKKPKYQATLFGDKTSSMLEALLDKVDELSAQVEVMENRLMDKMEEIQDDIKELPDKNTKNFELKDISKAIKSVKEGYNEVKKLGSKKITMVKAKFIINKYVRDEIETNLRNIAKITLPSEGGDESIDNDLLPLMIKLENNQRTTKKRCDKKNSPQQFLYQFYLTLISTEMVGYTALAYGYAVNELIYPDEKADQEIKIVIDDILNRIYLYNLAFSDAIPQLLPYFRTCDLAGNHERDVTFTELSGLYQAILYSEYSLRKCSDSCDINMVYPYATCYARPGKVGFNWDHAVKTDWTSDLKPQDINRCTTNLNCAGKIHNCRLLPDVDYCMDKNYTTRRYRYITDKRSRSRYGKWTNECEVYDFWDEGFNNEHYCPYCLCTCDDDTWKAPYAVNAVSLLPSRSDTWNNMVVTGMRIKVHEQMLHIQIKQGKIIDNYHIEPPKIKKKKKKNKKKKTSAKMIEDWVNLPTMKEDVRNSRRYEGVQNLREDVDFVAWHWDDNAFNLDEVSIPYGRVLTGVRFAMLESKGQEHKKRVQVQAESMEYDSVTGQLIQCTEQWTKPDPNNIHDVLLEFKKILPTESKDNTILESQTNQYVVPSLSDIWEDAGQSVLPFFDAQTIGCVPESPLGGIGLHHRSTTEESGFLGLSAHTVNYGAYLRKSAEKYAKSREDEEDEEEEDDEDDDDDDDDDDEEEEEEEEEEDDD